MHRRRFLGLAAGSGAVFAGCSRQSTTAPPTEPPTASKTVSSGSSAPTASSTTRTGTEDEAADTIFIGPSGADGDVGDRGSPLASIQEAIDRARPGQTIRVRPGEYREFLVTKRDGEPGRPITIAGPEEAYLRPPGDLSRSRILSIVHSHTHLVGMTFDGLADPDHPEDPKSYATNVIDAFPPQMQESHPDYLNDVKIMPDAIGNARRHVLGTVRTNHLEIGEFRLIGPAGTENLYAEFDEHPSGGIVANGHIGEVVQIGVKHNVFNEDEGDWYEWETPDESHDIHVHHIDNSVGHAHTELVELGTSVYDAVVESCTDAGQSGMYFLSQDHAAWTETSMALRGGRCTLRWCIIEDGYGSGVQIGTPPGFDRNLERYREIPASRFPGTNNEVYGNRIVGNAGLAIAFPYDLYDGREVEMGPEAQETICGNEFDGETQGDPASGCPTRVKPADPIGHLGGESPWK